MIASSGSVPIALHEQSSTLLLPSAHPSSLQAYSLSTSTLFAELEVTPSSRVSRQDDKPIEPPRVEFSVISSAGEWLATVDTRDGDDTFRGEIYLKIWSWDSKIRFWILNTRIDRPHGLERVTSVAFSHASRDDAPLHLVTTGQDGNIKLWRTRKVKRKTGDVEGLSSLLSESFR